MKEKQRELTYKHPIPYKTTDSETASILMSQNLKFATEKNDREVLFIFENQEKCKKTIDAHINNELVVSSLDLVNAQHQVKKIIINQARK